MTASHDASAAEGAPVLAVDLDGTLCRSDTLHEALFALLASAPLRLLALAPKALGDRAAFKSAVADEVIVDPATLPLNETVLETILAARAEGRRVVLVSAADQRVVDGVAAHTQLFDEAHGSNGPATGTANLSGRQKAAFLAARYGATGYDYIGDSRTDLPVWSHASTAVTVGATPRLRRAAEAANRATVHLTAPKPLSRRLRPWLRALRPHQWLKNLLVFLPMLAAHRPDMFGISLAAFVAFSLTASSVYVINDLVDLEADRLHPRKKNRPFASGAVPILPASAMAPALILAAVAISLAFTTPLFLATLGAYYLATFAYSFYFKRKAVLDVVVLAGLYTIRIIAGSAATLLVLTPWALAFSMFLFLALAAVKRQTELHDQLVSGRGDQVAGRAYRVDDLPVIRGMAISSGTASTLVLALYISGPDVQRLYSAPWLLWLICPLLLYWVNRAVMYAHRGEMTDDPIVFAARDRTSILTVLIMACLGYAAATF